MKNTNKTVGIFVIGMAITFAIAFFLLLVLPFNSALSGGDLYYIIWRENIFLYVLAIGTSITILTALKDHTKLVKSIVYPIFIGLIVAILAGLIFYDSEWLMFRGVTKFSFNTTVFLIVLGLGVFISFISLGTHFLKNQ